MNKAQARLRCRAILQTTKGQVNTQDSLWLLTYVFPRHPDWEEKQGPGVSHVEVRPTGSFKSLGFWLIRTDKTEVDISYKVSLDGRGTLYARTMSAAREEIHIQIQAWKVKNPAPRAGMNCDHVYPFEALFKDWLQVVRLQHEEIHVTRQLVGHSDLFLSRELGLSWQRYHKEHARFQWLTAQENSIKSNKIESGDDWLAAYDKALAEVF